MRIEVAGQLDGKKVRHTYTLFDEYCPETKVHSMARTTGYTATMAIRMLAKGLYNEKGIVVPEFIGKNHKCVQFILDGLADRGVNYELHID